MRKGKVSRRAPRASVIEVKNVPSGSTHVLCQIQVSLVAGKPVQKNDGGMRSSASGDIDQRVEQLPMAGNLKSLHGSTISVFAFRVCRQGNERSADTHCGRHKRFHHAFECTMTQLLS